MPRPKVHGHVTNENGAIACIIEFDNGFLMNIIVHDLGVVLLYNPAAVISTFKYCLID